MRDLETFDLIVTRDKGADAITFDVSDWTNVSALPGHTNFTGHTRTVIHESPIASASAQFCLTTLGCQARVAALQYDALNQQVWSYFPAGTHQGPNNLQLITVDSTAALNEAFSRASYVYLMAQVKGAGSLYLARFQITWEKPDFVDYGPSIADLVTRVNALEGGTGNGGPAYDDTELRERVLGLEAYVARIREVFAS